MKVRRCFVALNLIQSLFYFAGLVRMDPDLRQGDGVGFAPGCELDMDPDLRQEDGV